MGIGACNGSLNSDPVTRLDHCCWIGYGGGPCPALQELDGEPACGFMIASGGDWDAVYANPQYQTWVQPALEARGITLGCGDWPSPGQTCGDCGLDGDSEHMGDGTEVDIRITSMKVGDKNRYGRELADQLEAWEAANPPPGP